MAHKNPYIDANMPKDRVASGIYFPVMNRLLIFLFQLVTDIEDGNLENIRSWLVPQLMP